MLRSEVKRQKLRHSSADMPLERGHLLVFPRDHRHSPFKAVVLAGTILTFNRGTHCMDMSNDTDIGTGIDINMDMGTGTDALTGTISVTVAVAVPLTVQFRLHIYLQLRESRNRIIGHPIGLTAANP